MEAEFSRQAERNTQLNPTFSRDNVKDVIAAVASPATG